MPPSARLAPALIDANQTEQPGVEIIWEDRELESVDSTNVLGTQFAAGDMQLNVVSASYLPTCPD